MFKHEVDDAFDVDAPVQKNDSVRDYHIPLKIRIYDRILNLDLMIHLSIFYHVRHLLRLKED